MHAANNKAILAVLAVFTVAIAISSFRIVREYEFIGSKFIANLWVAAQAEIEFLRFVNQLEACESRKDATDDVVIRHYVLWSRLPLLLHGRESEHVRVIPGAVQTIQALTATLERLEPAILALENSNA